MIDFSYKIPTIEEFLSQLTLPPVVYGIGSCGRLVATTLKKYGITPVCFLDRNAQAGQVVDGINVYYPGQEHIPTSVTQKNTVILGLFNSSRSSHIQTVSSLLRQEIGFDNIICYENFYQIFTPDSQKKCWLAPPEYFQRHRSEIEECCTLWADEKSLTLFEALIQHRLGSSFKILPEPDFDEVQYLPKAVPLLSPPYNFVDMGCFDGDTIESFIANGVTFKKLLAFEPDLDNFNKLLQKRKKIDEYTEEAIYVPLGIGEKCHKVSFSSDGISSEISHSGNTTVNIIDFDSTFYGFKPDYIKMDIEGAEEMALKGMYKTIKTYKPMLAVCLYHRPQDLFMLPLLINKWEPDYKLYLRTYCSHCFDTVLYAVPKEN